jgi:hypothetical protein
MSSGKTQHMESIVENTGNELELGLSRAIILQSVIISLGIDGDKIAEESQGKRLPASSSRLMSCLL